MTTLLATKQTLSSRPFPEDLQAVGFDYDGTLVQPDRSFMQEVAEYVLRKLGYRDLEPKAIDAAFETNRPFEIIDPKNAILLHHLFFQEIDKLTRPLPRVIEGADESLAKIKESGRRIGIGTARMHSPKFYDELKATGLSKYIDSIVTRTDPYNMGSVKDQQLRRLFSEMWVPVENGIFVGDTVDDQNAASNTGIYSVGVLTGLASREELVNAHKKPDLILDSVAQLPKYIESQNKVIRLDELNFSVASELSAAMAAAVTDPKAAVAAVQSKPESGLASNNRILTTPHLIPVRLVPLPNLG